MLRKFFSSPKVVSVPLPPSAPVAVRVSIDELVPLAGESTVPAEVSGVVDTAAAPCTGHVTDVPAIETDGIPNELQSLRRRYLVRQAVVDAQQRLIGYELQLRKTEAESAEHGPLARLLDEMLLRSIIDLEIGRLLNGKLAFIFLSTAALNVALLKRLPCEGFVLAFRLPAKPDPEICAKLCALAAEGYAIALDECLQPEHWQDAIAIAHYARFDGAAWNALQLGEHTGSLLAYGTPALIIRNVDTQELFDASQRLAFRLFQGSFITRPQTAVAGKLDASRLHVVELLNLVKQQAEISELERHFKRDPILSYKLLRYINSPASGLTRKINSIAHAMVMLGYQPLYRWLTLLLFTSGNPDARSQTLMHNALVRARLIEVLGSTRLPQEKDALFITGILSLIDALLNIPMHLAVGQLSLPEAVHSALIHRQGLYAPYLDLAIACEEGNQEQIELHAALAGVDDKTLNVAHLQALMWAEGLEA